MDETGVRPPGRSGFMARVPTALADLFPPFALRVTAGPLEMRALTDDDLLALGDLALRGVHAPGAMPFYFPWTEAPAAELARNTAQYHWRQRASFSPAKWSLDLGVWLGGELVGTQAISTEDFLVTRTGETGSWLGLAHQGRGIGTTMRQAICALAFDHLGFEEVTSAAFLDNPTSLAVSRKVGYEPAGVRRLKRREGELALNQVLVLTPDILVRGEHEVVVQGAEAFRRAIGLPAGSPPCAP